MSDPLDQDLCAQAALVRDGQVSASELVTGAIGRPQAGAALNVLVDEQFDAAPASAAAIDATPVDGRALLVWPPAGALR